MKAGIIKFIESERSSRQSIVVREARRSSSNVLRREKKGGREKGGRKRYEKSSTWTMRERKSKGNNELVAQVMELTDNRTDVSFNYGK